MFCAVCEDEEMSKAIGNVVISDAKGNLHKKGQQ